MSGEAPTGGVLYSDAKYALHWRASDSGWVRLTVFVNRGDQWESKEIGVRCEEITKLANLVQEIQA